ncbi:hypothetical protein RUK17_003277 [Vibrio cholerae]|nr:hypothetical protein [Vibrio cholerae]EKF9803361.1 hypothetical protein [Vibrio cholerae]EKG0410949.1 hypothetical protein [Vibrio cholerae]ELJ8469384.1 hypothetical protein [Vibrio cholerae]
MDLLSILRGKQFFVSKWSPKWTTYQLLILSIDYQELGSKTWIECGLLWHSFEVIHASRQTGSMKKKNHFTAEHPSMSNLGEAKALISELWTKLSV